jgi:Fe-S-cluster containining protein
MSCAPPAHPVVTADVELTVNGRRLAMRVSVPAGAVAPSELLPLYRGVAEHLTARAVDAARAAGHAVSCQKGCGACCRQLVPVSTLEARELVKLVERMPEPRRSVIRQRFADARRRLEAEAPHLLERLLRPHEQSRDEAVSLGDEYFRLRIACPFLENESCSIYEDRPVDCRQYLVVSPAKYCAEDRSPHVRAITPWGGPVSAAIPASERTPQGKRLDWVHLILAPDFVARHPQEPPQRPGPGMVEEFFARFGKGERGADDASAGASQPTERMHRM